MTTPTNKAAFYADFGSLAALKRDAKVDSQKTLRVAAQQFESLFTDMMLKSMRAATSSIGDSLTGSSELDTYQGMFDQQLSAQLSKGRGMGLADMLVQQLTRSGLVPQAAASDQGGAVDATVGLKPNLQSEASDVSIAPATSPTAEPIASSSPSTASTSTTSTWPPATREAFVQAMLPYAQAAGEQLGVAPATLVAHAALETGWGKHLPCNADGSTSFNLFGIKARAASPGVAATTVEYEQGIAVKRVERFKTYESPAECFDDYAKLLGSDRYANARNADDDATQFAQGLQQGGYATDPQYANKLRAMVGAVRSIQVAATSGGATQIAAAQVSSSQADS